MLTTLTSAGYNAFFNMPSEYIQSKAVYPRMKTDTFNCIAEEIITSGVLYGYQSKQSQRSEDKKRTNLFRGFPEMISWNPSKPTKRKLNGINKERAPL